MYDDFANNIFSNIQFALNNLNILFEDYYLIAVIKPAGLITESDKFNHPSLQQFILDYLKQKHPNRNKYFLGVVHRLDRPVSGVIVFAKTPMALKQLNEQFSNKQTKKIYHAILQKTPSEYDGTLKNFISRDEKNKTAIISSSRIAGAQQAILHYKILKQAENKCLCKIELITGRFHQIRVQMSNIGCPVLNDNKYGADKISDEVMIFLHARQLLIHHPKMLKQLVLNAPFPDNSIWKKFTQA